MRGDCMILGVGIDLMEIVRMEEALSKEGFLDRFFSPEEKEYIVSRGKGAAESAAGCFAAKEAALKAMGCGIALPLRQVAVLHRESGAPYYDLREQAAEKMKEMGGERIHLSITHSQNTAAAVAIVEGKEK